MSQFTGLRRLFVNRNQIEHVDLDAFSNNEQLGSIYMPHNLLSIAPNMSHLLLLEDIQLNNNWIERIPPEHFRGLRFLHTMHIQNNRIQRLENEVFNDSCSLSFLDCGFNRIHTIEEDAFLGTKIEHLILQHNQFKYIPNKDIRRTAHTLNFEGVKTLINFPSAYTRGNQTFSTLQTLKLHYPTHCCWYKDYRKGFPSYSQSTGSEEPPTIIFNYTSLPGLPGIGKRSLDQFECPNIATVFSDSKELVTCSPPPDPFHPCYDIIEFLWLRIATWTVIVLALVGNSLVIAVLTYSVVKKTYTVPQLLIMNLAIGDTCMGVYLFIIAVADLDTAGNYENRALVWEPSAVCKIAGFFAITSSVVSISTLALITFERLTTIAFSYGGKRFVTVPRVLVCIACVWVISFIFALLPAVGVNDYGTVCICLPFAANSVGDKIYISLILLATGLVCFFILTCYIILFIRVKKTTSSLSTRQELKIAFKMSILVVTDFLVWAPVAVFGLAGALGGKGLIGLQSAKIIMVFVFPFNACLNPILYSIMQNAFRNQLCELISHCGLFREHNRKLQAQKRGLLYVPSTKITSPNRFRIGSLTSTGTFTSLLSLFGKRQSVDSLSGFKLDGIPQLKKVTNVNGDSTIQSTTSFPSGSRGSTMSDTNNKASSLSPIHEAVGMEIADDVFYNTNITEEHSKDINSKGDLKDDQC